MPFSQEATETEICAHWQKWWNMKGAFMIVAKLDLQKSRLVIENEDIARLTISENKIFFEENEKEWTVEWYILHSFRGGPDLNTYVNGRVVMNEKELRAAFNLPGGVIGNGQLAKYFGADVMVQGLFIRQRHYLNIPMPGSTLQGDPNISLFVHPETKVAVEKLLTLN